MNVSLLSVESIVKTAGGFAAGVAATLGMSQRAKDEQWTGSRLEERAERAFRDGASVSAPAELQMPKPISGHAAAPVKKGPAQMDADAYLLITSG